MGNPEIIESGLPEPLRAFSTTRRGGVSQAPFDDFNLGDACGDQPERVAVNRARLRDGLPAEPRWLRQVHGTTVIHLGDWQPGIEADAAWTDRPGEVVAVLTADCLPVVIAAMDGSVIGIAHAGWRGLAAGVLEALVRALPRDPNGLMAWIGPRIGGHAYEVDATVRTAFPGYPQAFRATRPGHWQGELPAIAGDRLAAVGVRRIDDCGLCTASDPQRFFSHRRDGRSGRMATLAWIEA
ncbi:MAG: peptidoglycan editing factor PgeF [Wenzhouxiangellaceae bacterium]|nr:peptidoglycan editing factor PgeF [Wenzhouxiangellaceae bacterium]